MNDNIDLFSNGLINIILKTKLYEELEAKQLEGFEFDFSLVTAVGDVKQGEAVIGQASVIPLKTTLCGLARIEEKYKQFPYQVVLDKSKMAKSSPSIKTMFQKGPGKTKASHQSKAEMEANKKKKAKKIKLPGGKLIYDISDYDILKELIQN